jgi:predicted RNA-binding Zn-ribbon protein involved in translation (DUF1610 family)
MDFEDKYRVYNWKNWKALHWIINPGVVASDLILGVQMPKKWVVDETFDKPRIERTYIPCPHCGSLHDDRTWSKKNGTLYKNWFGLYCPNCGEIIPIIRNATTYIILMLTFPIWGWFKVRLKANWLKKQPTRFENLEFEDTEKYNEYYRFILYGLGFALFMFVINSLFVPLAEGNAITWASIIFDIITWIIIGIALGLGLKYYSYRKGGKQKSQ